MYPDCLKDLVGLVQDGSPCLQGSDISNESTLGLFIDQDTAYDTCRFRGGDTACDLIKLMADRREEALRKITVDVGAVLMSKVRSKSESSKFLGQNSFGSDYASTLVPSQPSFDIFTEYQPGAYIRIDRIALMIYPKAGTITVPLKVYRVYSETDLELLHTFNITVVRRSTNLNAVVSYSLPCDGSTYRVLYDYDPDTMVVPLSNVECGCGDQLQSARGFRRINADDNNPVAQRSWGISLWVTYKCQDGQVICNLLRDETYKLVIGHMIRHQTILMILQRIYEAQEVNRWTLLSAEDAIARIESYSLEYNERLNWLSQQRDYDLNDGFCLQCGSGGSGMKKVNLLNTFA